VLVAAPTIKEAVSPEVTSEAAIGSLLPEYQVVGEGATGVETNGQGMAGMEGKENTGALPELGAKESEVVPPESNRGAAIGIAFGVLGSSDSPH
jgi:hypothetical protein